MMKRGAVIRLSGWTTTATFVPLDISVTTNSSMTPEERPVNLDDVQAVIDSAKARGTAVLEKYVRDRMPDASEQEVQDAAEVALEISRRRRNRFLRGKPGTAYRQARPGDRFVGFDPATEEFFSITEIGSGGGSVRHMFDEESTNSIWFGSDANTIGQANLPPLRPRTTTDR